MIPENDPDREARRVRAGLRSAEDRKLRQLIQEQRRLHQAMWNAPVVPLKQPYQRGWYRYLVLSEQASRRPDFEQLEILLGFVNQKQYCRKKRFLQYCPARMREVEMNHRPRRFTLSEMRQSKMPDCLLRYFRHTSGFRVINREFLRELPMRGCPGTFEVNCEHLFESVVAPYIVTHQKVDMPEVRSRLDEIDEYLEQSNGWGRYLNLTGERSWWCFHSKVDHAKLKRLAEREMREAKFAFNDGERFGNESDDENKGGTTEVVPFFWKVAAEFPAQTRTVPAGPFHTDTGRLRGVPGALLSSVLSALSVFPLDPLSFFYRAGLSLHFGDLDGISCRKLLKSGRSEFMEFIASIRVISRLHVSSFQTSHFNCSCSAFIG